MIKSLWCWIVGHKFWEWICTEHKAPTLNEGGYKKTLRVFYDRCLRCDKLRA